MMNIQIASKFNLFILCLVAVLTFNSCKDDDDDGNSIVDCIPGTAELASSALGDYTGVLGTGALNIAGTATITETSCKTYTVSFSDGVPSITGVRFIATSDNTVFTYVTSNATTTININGSGRLTVAKTDAPVIAFSGSK